MRTQIGKLFTAILILSAATVLSGCNLFLINNSLAKDVLLKIKVQGRTPIPSGSAAVSALVVSYYPDNPTTPLQVELEADTTISADGHGTGHFGYKTGEKVKVSDIQGVKTLTITLSDGTVLAGRIVNYDDQGPELQADLLFDFNDPNPDPGQFAVTMKAAHEALALLSGSTSRPALSTKRLEKIPSGRPSAPFAEAGIRAGTAM